MSAALEVSRIEWQGVRVPFRRPFVTAEGGARFRYAMLLTVRTEGGVMGWGEAGAVGAGTAASLRSLDALLRLTGPHLLGVPLRAVPARARAILGGSPLAHALGFGIETAIYDALGRARGRSVARLVGGEPRPVPVNATLGVASPAETARQARLAFSEGFTTLKLKVTGEGEQDGAVIEAVRAAVGSSVRLRLDPNQAWSAEEAVAALARLKRYGVEYVEQPVAARDIAGLVRVRREAGVPVAADETVTGLYRARRVLDAGAADVLVIKAARVGGLRAAAAILLLARRRGVPAVVTSSLETGVGIAASLHLAALTDTGWPACGLATGVLLESDLLVEPLLPRRGMMRVPERPGLGVEVDQAALHRYRAGPAGSVAAP
ncbi:MAG: mandelate racemase/muconate lactonizing enzyme family protein [Chloroflexi bacterium]|nr:mandelate racemase/muconate lactonizing enzyme family protein [Chloroflexota bacterium]